MSHPLAHTIYTLIQQLQPDAKSDLMQMIASDADREVPNFYLDKNGAIQSRQKDMYQLNKVKGKLSKQDLQTAIQFVKLPNDLIQFFTVNNFI